MSATALPLLDFHRRLGGRIESYRGVDAPAVYSDTDEEYRALSRGCGLSDRSWVTRLEMRGEDRLRYLNGLVTCEVKNLEPGQRTYGFLTSQKGRILSDVAILALEDSLWLELSPDLEDEMSAHLMKYVIVDRVELKPLDWIPVTLIGPRSTELVSGLAELPEKPAAHHRVEILGTEVRLARDVECEVSVWTCWVAEDAAEGFLEKLLEHGRPLGLRPVGHQATERWRIAEAYPLFGRDFSSDNFPQETGIEGAVSYTKGCYLGQEVVARIHYRGGVNRHLRGLVLGGDGPVTELVGRPVLSGGKESGTLTSAAEVDGRRLGLAMLHQRAEPGSRVELGDGTSAEVVALPF